MDSEMTPAIQALELHRKKQLEDLAGTEAAINQLYKLSGQPEPYATGARDSAALGSIKADSFYGAPLATAVKTYLQMRKASGMGPATVGEIYAALITGGYEFESKNPENAKRVLRISLSKNPAFHRLPTGQYGLLAWYPTKSARADDDGSDDTEVEDAEGAAAPEPEKAPKPTKAEKPQKAGKGKAETT